MAEGDPAREIQEAAGITRNVLLGVPVEVEYVPPPAAPNRPFARWSEYSPAAKRAIAAMILLF
jgi:hypothetical protein